MNATVSIETVPPKKAQHYLACLMECQRSLREGHVLRLATEIEAGNWHTTGDALIFVKGKLANGQHRLHAVILADKACEFIVMRTDDENLYKVLDAGLARTTGDAVAHLGLEQGKTIAAVALMTLRYDLGALTTFGRNAQKCNQITRSHVLDYVEEHQAALEKQVQTCMSLNTSKRIAAPALSGTLLHLGKRSGKGDIETFITNLYLGGTQDAAWDLRERMIRNNQSKMKLRREFVFALMIKAYKSFVNGTRPGVLKMLEGEPYPKMP